MRSVQAPQLAISPERAFFILVKAREFDVKVEETDPDSASNPSDDAAIDVLEETSDDPTFEEYLGALKSLNEDEQLDLLALLWIGRGDFTADEWADARAEAVSVTTKHIPEYISATPLASDYLEEGLSALGISLEAYEKDRL